MSLRPEADAGAAGPSAVERVPAELVNGLASGQWRSLDELAGTPEFRAWVEDEFPERASLLALDRRKFMQVMGASLALAGLSGCRYLPQRKAVPQVETVEDLVPGVPRQYATAVVLSGIGTGVLARSNDGRPTKIEGNALHPGSLGATDAFAQAAVLDLYDPERLRNVTRSGQVSTWDAFLAEARGVLASQRSSGGAGVRIVTGAVTSPTLAGVIRRLLTQYPRARWIQWEPVHRDNLFAGMRQAWGRPLSPAYRFDRADVVLTLDADPLDQMPGHVRYAHDLMSRRRVRGADAVMSRLYAVESVSTNMGATADHRLPTRAADVAAVATQLASDLGIRTGWPVPDLGSSARRWIAACAADLKANTGRAVVVVGDQHPPELHALVACINHVLGATGATLDYIEPVYAELPDTVAEMATLADDMHAGRVGLLLMFGVNPVYDAPADLRFGQALKRVPVSASAGLRPDETAARCSWVLPEAHSLEAWGDCRAYDGSASVIQPLIQPMYDARSAAEVLAALAGRPASGYELVRSTWRTLIGQSDFARRWNRIIHDGVATGTAFTAVAVAEPTTPAWAQRSTGADVGSAGGLELVFAADPTLWDGRFASNGWLQELPKPLTRLTWDNAALVGPATASKLGLADGDVVEMILGDRKAIGPVRVQPGHPADTVTVHLGHGRELAGAVGSGVGFSAYALRSREAMWHASGLRIQRTGARHTFARTEHQHAISNGRLEGMQGRDIVRVLPIGGRHQQGKDAGHGSHGGRHPSLYDPGLHAYDGHRWGMSIDLTLCTGCNACVLACQSENNIPVVGKEQVARGRSMHWMRIDRYFEGDAEAPAVHHQPVLCMHCENAPCEPVCPVAATVHSREGLNQMVYNRCVGTRYCSNNCPYKVRRFNFLNYANHNDVPIAMLMHNPNVTVRGRGVMEKCTFCVQRISAARIGAKKAGRPIADGEVVTACQAACPPRAITFGDIADPNSAVSREKREDRDYALLDDLNTRPRLTYLAKLTNRNPELESRA